MENSLQNNTVHRLFETAILIKGINGIWEVIVGVLFFFFKKETISHVITYFVGTEISGHFTKDYVIRQANNLSLSTKHFIAWYFLFYGLANLFLLVFLLRKKVWAYPVAVAFFVLFILYQCYRFTLYHSVLLLLFTLFDISLVILTWLEYTRIRRELGTTL